MVFLWILTRIVRSRCRVWYSRNIKFDNIICYLQRSVYKLGGHIEMHKNFLIVKNQKLICTVHVKKGNTIFSLEGSLHAKPTPQSVHIGEGVHIIDDCGTFLTHSFDPNCCISRFFVVALREIKPGDVLTYNFNETEINMAQPFVHDGIIVKGK